MSLVENPRKRMALLCALYFAQGLPWGFMDETLINFLMDQGVSKGEAAGVSAVILLPWTFKLIWAPLIDTVTIRSMGKRRPWIIIAQFFMALTLIGILMVPDITTNYRLLALMFFIHNIFASFQDVSTDALAVDILPPGEQGKANGMMWASKLVGFGVGAAGFARVMDASSIETAVLLQIVILIMIMVLPILWVERAGEKRFPWSSGEVPPEARDNFRSLSDVGRNTLLAFSLRTTFVFVIFTLVHNLGPEIGKFTAKGNCLNQLGWTYVEASDMRGLALLPELILVLLGGFLADRWGRRTVLVIGMTSYGLLNLVAATMPTLWMTSLFPEAYLVFSPGLIAVGAVGFLSMAMRISWTAAAATVFTTYMTLSNVSAIIGKTLVGVLTNPPTVMDPGMVDPEYVAPLTWQNMLNIDASSHIFLIAAALAVIPLILLPFIRPADVDRAKEKSDGNSTGTTPENETPQESPGEDR
jgi:PAT family beta-lactamase induction signal transducer AmpG